MSKFVDEQNSRNQPENTTGDRNIIIENKVDFLINLNLILLNLVISLSKDESKGIISENIMKELESIHQTIPKILTAGESKSVFIDQIGNINAKLAEITKVTASEEGQKRDEPLTPSQPFPKEPEGDYSRKEYTIDKWGIVESLETLIASYKDLSHLSFPNFYLMACKEIQHYEIHKEIDYSNPHEIIQIPALKLKDLILKLLREAPSARLLQNLRKLFPLQGSREPPESEKKAIQEIVEKYFSNIIEYIKGNRSLQDTIRISSSILQQFNLGSGDLESRIPNVSFIIVKEIHDEFQKARGNEFKQYIYSETIVLIHRLNGAVLHNEYYKTLLRRLK